MEQETTASSGKRWNMVERIKGDKVVWMVVLLLIMISMITISGSTSLLAIDNKTTRLNLLTKHLWVCAGGLALIFVIYKIRSIKFFEFFSKYGFLLSVILLAALDSHFKFGDSFKTELLNGAYRTIRIWKIQVHVFEVVKVAMVMYLAWACKSYKEDSFRLSKRLAALNIYVGKERDRKLFAFMDNRFAEMVFYILIPIGVVTGLVLPGSNSSAVFILAIMVLTVLVGGVDFKYIMMLAAVGICVLAGGYGIYKLSDGKYCKRIGTALSRADKVTVDSLFIAKEKYGKNSKEYKKVLTKLQQPYAAKIAINEGGLLKKGFGGSTQKYVVPVMYGDFMYSFILEETGLLGGLAIIILYMSLMARGSIIVKNCKDTFAQTAVGGLVLLIVGQAFMHIFINLDVGLLTGQTLPLISHGSSAFLCFSIAFGIILSISKMAWKETSEQEREADIEHGRPVEDTISADTGDF